MKQRIFAVFFGILLGAFVAFAQPPPALAHHQPAAVYGSMTGKPPVVVVADQVFTLSADVVAVAEWPTVVYLAADRPKGDGRELALSPGIANLNFERRVGSPDIAVSVQYLENPTEEKGLAYSPTTATFSAQGGDRKVFFAGLRSGFSESV